MELLGAYVRACQAGWWHVVADGMIESGRFSGTRTRTAGPGPDPSSLLFLWSWNDNSSAKLLNLPASALVTTGALNFHNRSANLSSNNRVVSSRFDSPFLGVIKGDMLPNPAGLCASTCPTTSLSQS